MADPTLREIGLAVAALKAGEVPEYDTYYQGWRVHNALRGIPSVYNTPLKAATAHGELFHPFRSTTVTAVIDLLKDVRARLLEYVRDDETATDEGGGLYGSQAAEVAAPYITRIDALLEGEQHG